MRKTIPCQTSARSLALQSLRLFQFDGANIVIFFDISKFFGENFIEKFIFLEKRRFMPYFDTYLTRNARVSYLTHLTQNAQNTRNLLPNFFFSRRV